MVLGHVSSTLASGCGDSPGKILRAMRLLEHAGYPPTIGQFDLAAADGAKPRIYILKAKPTCWRVYFGIDGQGRRFLYALAICKQQQKRKQSDTDKARRRFEEALAGDRPIQRITFPAR